MVDVSEGSLAVSDGNRFSERGSLQNQGSRHVSSSSRLNRPRPHGFIFGHYGLADNELRERINELALELERNPRELWR